MMGILKIYKPEITIEGGNVKLIAKTTLESDEEISEKYVWYMLDAIYENILYTDRVDAFLVALLPYCLTHKIDIEVSEDTGVSADLLYQIRHILIPTLDGEGEYNKIEIAACPLYTKLREGTECASAVSRGIDSSYVLFKCLQTREYMPTYGVLFNVQAYGDFGGEIARENFQCDIERAQLFLDEFNQTYETEIKLLVVDSNIQEAYQMGIRYAGTFRDIAPVILLRQLIRVFHFAVGHKLNEFNLNKTRTCESWTVPCLNTEGQKIYCFGSEESRIGKLGYISQYPIMHKHLSICRTQAFRAREGKRSASGSIINCTVDCEKCRCTVSELIALGQLEHYGAVFDLEKVKENLDEIEQKGKRVSLNNEYLRSYWRETYEVYKENREIK